MSLYHPETRPTENFVGNSKFGDTLESKGLASLKTARFGKVAYDIHGKKLTEKDYMKPLFIGKSESQKYDDIKMAEIRKIRRGS